MPASRLPQGGTLLVEGGEAPEGRRQVGGAPWGTGLDVEVEMQRDWSVYFRSPFLVLLLSSQVVVCLLFLMFDTKLTHALLYFSFFLSVIKQIRQNLTQTVDISE